eukprot:Skav226390  [mRNA]  locus=scaffold1631:67277:74756:+ [translate_table: standard]
MSQDGDLLELSVKLRNLTITVKGPAGEATEFLSSITTGSLARRSASPVSTDRSFVVVEAAPCSSHSQSVGEPSFRASFEPRSAVESSFVSCPARLFVGANRLSGSALSPEDRVDRAWVAGQWARAVIAKRVSSPTRTKALDLRSRVYAVAVCDSLDSPVIFKSSGSYFRTVGLVEESDLHEALTFESLLTVEQEVEPYVLQWPSEHQDDGSLEVHTLVVMKRSDGALLAVPAGSLPEVDLDFGNHGIEQTLGFSTEVSVPSMVLDGGQVNPTGEQVRVTLIDCRSDIASFLRTMRPFEEIAYGFDPDMPLALPDPMKLVDAAHLWIQDADPLGPLAFYSAEEMGDGDLTPLSAEAVEELVPGTPHRAKTKQEAKAKATRARPGAGGKPDAKPEKPKKVTAASLAASLDQILVAMPALSGQLQELRAKQDRLESQVMAPVSAACPALQQPLSRAIPSSVLGHSVQRFPMPSPPKTAAAPSPGLLRSHALTQPAELLALEQEKPLSQEQVAENPLAQAVLAQSQALTSLVSQIAQNQMDPMQDLSGTATTGTRGSVGRAKLQADLASQRGLFFNSVMSAMARRMHPTVPVDGTPQQLMERGVCGTRYLERFGGYARFRDLGQLQYQVMQILDFLQTENVPAARDHCALLAVTLEQAVLDNGKFELASILCLQDDLPSSIFQNRQAGMMARSRSFSPLADQKWITIALAYLKEMDLIVAKRAELAGSKFQAVSSAPVESSAPVPDPVKVNEVFNPFEASLDFDTWCLCLPRWILNSRADFAWRLRRSFRVSRRAGSLPTTAFPLPAPYLGHELRGGPNLSKKLTRKLGRARALHCIVLALNHLYLGRFPSNDELGRRITKVHVGIFDRLRSVLAVCGSARGEFPLAPGRSGPELASCLMHLESFVDGCSEFQDPYRRSIDPLAYHEDPTLLPADRYPQLVPYRDLDASRLRIVGSGHWNAADFISGPLWIPFVEPRFLRHDQSIAGASVPIFCHDDPAETFKLAKLWDVRGLLELFSEPVEAGDFCKVFQVYKSAEYDRQIGDRRLVNAKEYHVSGPSKHLPPGPLLTQLHLRRWKDRLLGSVTDRRDFYHQCKVSLSRAQSNMLSTPFPLSRFVGTQAHANFLSRNLSKPKKDRVEIGDQFKQKEGSGVELRSALADGQSTCQVYPSFRSLFQGDHLGVEYALSAHEGVLEEEGVLSLGGRLLGHSRVPLGRKRTGLIIDDFFAIGAEPLKQDRSFSFAATALAAAREVYKKYDVEGSPEKDVEGEDLFKAAGAEIDSRLGTVRNGLCLVSSPFGKRFGLSTLSFRVARLPSITPKLAARLSGNWVSSLLYRRCVSSVVDGFFALSAGLERPDCPALVPLSRGLAQELVLLATLVPLMISNVAAELSSKMYASDASNDGGAVASIPVKKDLTLALWQATDKKGGYTRLDSSSRALLKHHVPETEFLEDVPSELTSDFEGPFKAPLLRFDFVEICGGAGVISRFALDLGLVVAPVLDLSESVWYDLRGLRFLEWCMYMLESGLFASFIIQPPCASFSSAAHPAVRSYARPLGFSRVNPKTFHGNELAFKSFVLLKHGRKHGRPCGIEQPRLSKMAWLSFWQTLRDLGFVDNILASCQFGSQHKKEFRFCLYLFDWIEAKCPGGHRHVRIQGKYTRPSAVYCPGLGRYLAEAVVRAVSRVRRLEAEEESQQCAGFESIVCNDLMTSHQWNLEKSWGWKNAQHINVQETYSSVTALSLAAVESPDSRVVFAVDSQVARCALAKGRSSSRSLQPSLKRSCALQLAFGLHPSWIFAPTRLNVPDDAARGLSLRAKTSKSFLECFDLETLADLHQVGLRRPFANWIRLWILVQLIQPASGFSFRLCSALQAWPLCVDPWVLCVASVTCLLCARLVCGTFLDSPLRAPKNLKNFSYGLKGFPKRFTVLALMVLVMPHVAHSAMSPQNEAERNRAAMRTPITLPADRVVRKETRNKRFQLLTKFKVWLWSEHKVSFRALLEEKPFDAELISHWVVMYGRELFASGKAYYQYSETINAIAMTKPLLKKQLTAAWDLAFAWLGDEPHEHHPALPVSVLLAMMTLSLYWGWVYEACVLGATWAGVMRIGEFLQACRKDLVLPQDTAPGNRYVLLRIPDPKTRGRHARHQSARIDQEDIVNLLIATYGSMDSHEPLWPFSAATLRSRFSALLRALDLPTSKKNGCQPFGLSSLRPGGATWMLDVTENSELVRRRGRWLSNRVMEVYLQEISAATFLQKLSATQRSKIFQFATDFETVLQQALFFLNRAIPPRTWYLLMNLQRGDGKMGKDGQKAEHNSAVPPCGHDTPTWRDRKEPAA